MTAAELQVARFRQTLHLKLGRGGYGADYVCVDDPRVEIRIRRPTRKEPQRVTIHVGDHVFERGDWSGVAAFLADIDNEVLTT